MASPRLEVVEVVEVAVVAEVAEVVEVVEVAEVAEVVEVAVPEAGHSSDATPTCASQTSRQRQIW